MSFVEANPFPLLKNFFSGLEKDFSPIKIEISIFERLSVEKDMIYPFLMLDKARSICE